MREAQTQTTPRTGLDSNAQARAKLVYGAQQPQRRCRVQQYTRRRDAYPCDFFLSFVKFFEAKLVNSSLEPSRCFARSAKLGRRPLPQFESHKRRRHLPGLLQVTTIRGLSMLSSQCLIHLTVGRWKFTFRAIAMCTMCEVYTLSLIHI